MRLPKVHSADLRCTVRPCHHHSAHAHVPPPGHTHERTCQLVKLPTSADAPCFCLHVPQPKLLLSSPPSTPSNTQNYSPLSHTHKHNSPPLLMRLASASMCCSSCCSSGLSVSMGRTSVLFTTTSSGLLANSGLMLQKEREREATSQAVQLQRSAHARSRNEMVVCTAAPPPKGPPPKKHQQAAQHTCGRVLLVVPGCSRTAH